MPFSPYQKYLASMFLACGCLGSVSSSAETLAELDTISDISADEATGIAAAREQAGRGTYLEALATLERVLAVHPKSAEARLLHAVYLCQIDDRRGGLVEISKLKTKKYSDEVMAEVRTICAPVAGG